MLRPYNRAEVQFELIGRLGEQGHNSTTYFAHDHQLDADIVIKKVEKAALNSPSDFFDESKALYASSHANVVQIHYACQDSNDIFLAMPHYQNGSVQAWLDKEYMTVRDIVTVGCHVLSGLHNIHSKGLIHFDVKPDNILLSDRCEGLLSDFGLAKQMNYAGIAAQDRHYLKMTPPEAMTGDQFDSTFDIFQFGLTLYRMCNGNQEFYTQFRKYGPPNAFDRDAFRQDVRSGDFPDRSRFLPHIPQRLRKTVKQCIDVNPAKRFRSAVDVANALAVIDGKTLDWRYETAGDTRIWTKNEGGTSFRLEVDRDNASTCIKTTQGGQPRRVAKGCKKSISLSEIKAILGEL